VVNKRLKQNWEYEEKNLVLHLNYSFHNYLRLQWALRQFVGNALGNGNPLGKFKVPLTSVCLSSPSGWTSHLLNNPLAKLLHGSTSSWSSSQGQITDGFFMVLHSCWHNFPVGTTSHWNNFPLEQLPKSQLPTGTTSLFIQLPYSYNFPMAQLTPGTTSLWHNLPLAQLILEQLPYGTSSYGTTSRGRAFPTVICTRP